MKKTHISSKLLLVIVAASLLSVSIKDAYSAPETRMIEVESGANYFEPNILTVNKGDHIILTIRNVGGEHQFTINEFDVNEALEVGKAVTVEFEASKGGRFMYYCGIHPGMRGWLEVKVPWDKDPPSISDVRRKPEKPATGRLTTFTAKIMDESGIKEASILYAFDKGPWQSMSMTPTTPDDTWIGSLPSGKAGSMVQYYLKAVDYAGYSAETITFDYTIAAEPTPWQAEGGSREIRLTARQFGYDPPRIEVNEGEELIIHLKSLDTTHGFYIDGYGVNTTITPEEEKTIQFTADKAGKFRIRCFKVCGTLHPFMVGEFVVKPNRTSDASVGSLLLVSIGSIGLLTLRNSQDMAPTALPNIRGRRYDILKIGLVRKVLTHRAFQFFTILPDLIIFLTVIATGLLGNSLGSRNFSIIFVWIIWWSALKLFFAAFGSRLWCTMCPIPAVGEWTQRRSLIGKREGRFFGLGRRWPARFRNLWVINIVFIAIASFIIIVTTRPLITAALLLGLMATAFILAMIFERRAFCRYACPVGGFLGQYSMFSSLELRVKDPQVCIDHKKKECVEGNEKGYGCPWMVYPGNMDRSNYCGLCTECLKTCSKDNISFNIRPFASELHSVEKGSLDEAAVSTIMLATGIWFVVVMEGPWAWLKDWANMIGPQEFSRYASMFLGFALFLTPAAFITFILLSRDLAGVADISLRSLFTRYSCSLIPIGLLNWMAFSIPILFVNISYIFSTVSDPFGWGWNVFGTRDFPWAPFYPEFIPHLQIFFLAVGLFYSLKTADRASRSVTRTQRKAFLAFLPMAVFITGVALMMARLYAG